MIRNTIPYFPIFKLPAIGPHPSSGQDTFAHTTDHIEVVKLESGFYFGDRNTEPRAALVIHLALSQLRSGGSKESLKKPLDVFVVNLHLTTLTKEREGVPEIDEEAAQTRLRQLEIVLNGIVSRYNRWSREEYPIRGEKKEPRPGETHTRHSPIWVIAGDFNFAPESVEYNTMIRRGFIDLISNHDLGTKTAGLGEKPALTVDYVFAGPRFQAIDPVVVREGIVQNHVEVTDDTMVSDHFPLIVNVPIALDTA